MDNSVSNESGRPGVTEPLPLKGGGTYYVKAGATDQEIDCASRIPAKAVIAEAANDTYTVNERKKAPSTKGK